MMLDTGTLGVDTAQIVTQCGDSLFLLPASTLLSAYLILFVSSGIAVTWIRSLIGCLAAVAVCKTAAYSIADLSGATVISISGHSAFAALFYTSASLIATRRRTRWIRGIAMAAAFGLVGAVAASRLALAAHTPMEAALGTLLGAAFTGVFAHGYGTSARSPGRRFWSRSGIWSHFSVLLVLTAGRVAIEFSGVNLEEIIRAMAAALTGTPPH